VVASIVSDVERLYVSTLAKVTALDASKLERGGDPVIWSQEIGGEKSSTPVVADGLLFLVTEDGTAMCLDAATGAVQWKHRFKRRYYASVIAAGRFVYFVSEPGCISVVARDRAFKLEADNKLGEKIYATPVPAGNRLLIRTVEALYCIRGPSH
jgi:outer membrane protein assembly factor BamB